MHHHVIIGLFQVSGEHFCERSVKYGHANVEARTITTSVEIHDVAHPDVDYAEEALVLLLELLLVEYLNRDDAVLGYPPISLVSVRPIRQIRWQALQVKAFVPVGIQRLLYHTRRPCLLSVDCRNRERVREAWAKRQQAACPPRWSVPTEDISFVEAVGSNN